MNTQNHRLPDGRDQRGFAQKDHKPFSLILQVVALSAHVLPHVFTCCPHLPISVHDCWELRHFYDDSVCPDPFWKLFQQAGRGRVLPRRDRAANIANTKTCIYVFIAFYCFVKHNKQTNNIGQQTPARKKRSTLLLRRRLARNLGHAVTHLPSQHVSSPLGAVLRPMGGADAQDHGSPLTRIAGLRCVLRFVGAARSAISAQTAVAAQVPRF